MRVWLVSFDITTHMIITLLYQANHLLNGYFFMNFLEVNTILQIQNILFVQAETFSDYYSS